MPWQADGHRQTGIGIGHFETAAIGFDDIRNDRQAEAVAAALAVKLNATHQSGVQGGARTV